MKHTAAEYVNPKGYSTNNVENFFGICKRGMRGTYTFCGEQHLQRYLVEFEFRYNNVLALASTTGNGRCALSRVSRETARRTGRLTAIRNKKQAAKRFLAWRKRKKSEK